MLLIVSCHKHSTKKTWKLLSKWLTPFRNTNTNVIVISLLWLHSLIVVKVIYHKVSNQIYSSKNACNAWLPSTFIFAPLSVSFYFSPFPLCPLGGSVSLLIFEIKRSKLCNSMCLVCCCISIINPQSHSASQTSPPKVSERSWASAADDDSCFCGARSRFSRRSSSSSIISHCMCNTQNINLGVWPQLVDWFGCWIN